MYENQTLARSTKPTMNFENRTLFIADNLEIMRGMDSDTVDLIYLDPPFKSGKQWRAPIGSPAEGAEFKDIWTDADIKDEWHGQIAAEDELARQNFHLYRPLSLPVPLRMFPTDQNEKRTILAGIDRV